MIGKVSILTVVVLLFLAGYQPRLFAQGSSRVAVGINAGLYHSFSRSPDSSEDIYFEKKYYLRERIPITIELFRSAFFDSAQTTRLGIRLGYLSVRRYARKGSSYFTGAWEQENRLYGMLAISLVIQRKIYELNRLQMLLDWSGGIASVKSKGEALYSDYCDTFMCLGDWTIESGMQLGVVFLVRVRERIGIRISPRYHLQPSKLSPGFPFSSGLVMDVGIVGENQ